MTVMNIRNKKAKWKKKSADLDFLIPFPILKTAYESLGSFFLGRRNQWMRFHPFVMIRVVSLFCWMANSFWAFK